MKLSLEAADKDHSTTALVLTDSYNIVVADKEPADVHGKYYQQLIDAKWVKATKISETLLDKTIAGTAAQKDMKKLNKVTDLSNIWVYRQHVASVAVGGKPSQQAITYRRIYTKEVQEKT